MDLLHLLETPVSSSFSQWWNGSTSPSFCASCSASVFQSTDVSNSAALHCSCLTSLRSCWPHKFLWLSQEQRCSRIFFPGVDVEAQQKWAGFKLLPWPFWRAGSELAPLRSPMAAAPLCCQEWNCRLNVSAAAILLSQHKYLYRTLKLLWKLSIPMILFIPPSTTMLDGMNQTVCLPVSNSEMSPDSQ